MNRDLRTPPALRQPQAKVIAQSATEEQEQSWVDAAVAAALATAAVVAAAAASAG
jgi:hypothetical protein